MGKHLVFGLSRFDLDKIDFINEKYDDRTQKQYFGICYKGKEYIKDAGTYGKEPPVTYLLSLNLYGHDINNFAYVQEHLINMDRIEDFFVEQEQDSSYSLSINFKNNLSAHLFNDFDKNIILEHYNKLAEKYDTYKNEDIHLIIPTEKTDDDASESLKENTIEEN